MAIKLKSPITINIPSIKKADGTTKNFPSVVLKEIDYIVSYDNAKRVATVTLKDVNRSLQLWSGEDYDRVGQFTDLDVEARITELLGKDVAGTITALFQSPSTNIKIKKSF